MEEILTVFPKLHKAALHISDEDAHCPSLDKLQPLRVFLVMSGPKMETGPEVWAQQC